MLLLRFFVFYKLGDLIKKRSGILRLAFCLRPVELSTYILTAINRFFFQIKVSHSNFRAIIYDWRTRQIKKYFKNINNFIFISLKRISAVGIKPSYHFVSFWLFKRRKSYFVVIINKYSPLATFRYGR